MSKSLTIGLYICLSPFILLLAQDKDPLLDWNNGMRFRLNEDGTHYLKFTFINQTWIRWNQNNPGSTIGTALYNRPEAESWDISLRRTRAQFFGQLTHRLFMYAQFGQNNFNYLSQRKTNVFFHDVIGEYAFVPKHLHVGAGLTGWSGPARFAAPSVATIMGMDAPLFEQWNNDVNDQFLRHLSIYAKGKIGKLDYRIALAKPMITQNASVAIPPLTNYATYSLNPPQPQLHSYVMYQFLDQEANITPYTTGTYLGKKRVFNIGAGFVEQANAMWHLESRSDGRIDTVSHAMRVWAVDVYYDAPVGAKGAAISAYLAHFDANMGPGFLRNLGVNNIANGTIPSQASLNGTGNAFPMFGTGQTKAAQVGFKFKDNLLGEWGTLMPYAMAQWSNYQRLRDKMLIWNMGLHWLMRGHNSKMTLDYQNRPVFNHDGNSIDRKGMLVLQWQVGIF